MDLTTLQGVRQSGSMTLKTKISSPEASGSIDLRVEEYSTKYDVKTQNTQVKYRGNLDVSVKSSQTDYDNYDEDTEEYGRIAIVFSATIRYDITLVISRDGTMYMTLSSLDGRAQGYEYAKTAFDTMMTMARAYIGKTYQIPSQYNSSQGWDVASLQSTIRNGLIVLDTVPFFVTQSEKNGVYTLTANRAVIKTLGLPPMQSIITYTNQSGIKTITLANVKNPKKNYITLTENAGKYSLSLIDKSITRGKKSNLALTLERDMMSMTMKDKETDMRIEWKNKILDMKIISKEEYSPEYVFTARGPLSLDGSDTNIVFGLNGKDIGSLRSIRSGGVVNYALNMTLGLDMTQVLLDWSGMYSEERGEYSVTLPTIYEILDSSRITD
jgi:hypothetical protein